MERTEIIISEGGLFLCETVRRRLELTPAFFDEMSRYASFSRRNIFDIPGWGMAHCRFKSDSDYYSLALDRIPLRCDWRVTDNGIMTPDFCRDSSSVVFEKVWQTPETMILVMLCRVKHKDADICRVEKQWLMAFRENSSDCYRLPLANIHDDGRLCDDKEGASYHGPTPALAIQSAMTKFAQSNWNADLWSTEAQTRSMFQFQAVGGDHLQLPIMGQWWNLCTVIAPDILGEVIL